MDVNQKNNKIMIVDGNPDNAGILEIILQLNGYGNIKSLTDSRQVLKQYIEYRPDLILLHLMMPYVDGFEVLEKLKSVEEDLPVIVVAAQSERERRLKALDMGAQDFIDKPLNSAEVLARIRNFFKIRRDQSKQECSRLLEDRLRKETGQTDRLEKEVAEQIACATERLDYNTGSHIDRIEDYTYALGRAIGLSGEQCRALSVACKLHDIGKAGIPDEILLKPGALNAKEWEIVKCHPRIGVELLNGSSSGIMLLAEEIARTHHEKWDGTGYPNGLCGEEIPLSGRIMALIDVFDALLSKRPYKEAWEFDWAALYVKFQSGKHFDPAVVKAFIKSLKDFEKIYKSQR